MTILLGHDGWPDVVDWSAIFVFFSVIVLLPILGHWFMILDIRAYYRALRGVLIIVINHLPDLPGWARQETPACLRALELKLPCKEADVKEAYRRLAEELHPDRGGDRKQFLRLQNHFEQALKFVQDMTVS